MRVACCVCVYKNTTTRAVPLYSSMYTHRQINTEERERREAGRRCVCVCVANTHSYDRREQRHFIVECSTALSVQKRSNVEQLACMCVFGIHALE